MSRVVILVGSVRKGGNTELLAGAFAEGARLHNEVEIVSVADYRIHPCTGCNCCFSNEDHVCVQNDDMALIYEKLRNTDTLVVASPVYFYGISAQLKAMIDRLHTPMRNSFPIRQLGLILVGGATLQDLFDPIVMQYQMICRFFNLESIGTVLVSGAKEKGDVRCGDGMQCAFELGSRLNQKGS